MVFPFVIKFGFRGEYVTILLRDIVKEKIVKSGEIENAKIFHSVGLER